MFRDTHAYIGIDGFVHRVWIETMILHRRDNVESPSRLPRVRLVLGVKSA